MTEFKKTPTFLAEVLLYLRHSKRWWLTPIIMVLLFLALVALLSGLAPALPFIYTLF
jgi:hypothetical protein